MKYLSIFLLSLFLFGSNPKPTENSFVVVQLFTSQGCSSCPPADRLIERIKEEYKDQKVYVLSYHVDYWDRLGWKDPFSKREYTELQYSYADQFRERQVYTPQIVVNGKEHFVGSNGSKLRNRIKTYLKKDAGNSLEIKSKKTDKNTEFTFTIGGETKDKTLKLAFVLDNHVTQVKRGENSNKVLSNSNVVLEETALTLNKSTAKFSIPKNHFGNQKVSLIAFVQNKQLEVTAAKQIDF